VPQARRARANLSDPLTLLFTLCDTCMPLLSGNAWKVVSYVGRKNLSELRSAGDPVNLLMSDLAEIVPDVANSLRRADSKPSLEIVYDNSGFPRIFTPVSLAEFSRGERLPNGKNRDGGTGLSKSSVTDAINEAIAKGILERKKRASRRAKAMPSVYGVNWQKVFELSADLMRRRRPHTARMIRPRPGHVPVHEADSSKPGAEQEEVSMKDMKRALTDEQEQQKQKRAEAVLADPSSTDEERMAAEAVLGYDEPDDDETGPSSAEIEFYSPGGGKGSVQ
jgi:hypothetical protein